MRASALVIAGVIVLAGCTSEQTLAPDPAGAEPGYPQYTPPATSPDGVSPGGTPDPVETSDEPEVPGGSPPATPTAEPTPTPTVDPSATPPPSAAPEPTAAPTSAPSTPVPTTPPTSASPTTPAPTTPTPTTPAAVVLQTQTWQPPCGATLTAPPDVNQLSVAVSLQAITNGELRTEAVLTNGAEAPIAAEHYAASVTIARSGTVVSTWVEGQDVGPAIALAARGTLVVPVDHDLKETCPAAGGVRSPGPPSATSTSAASISAGTSSVAPPPPTEDDLVLNPEPAVGAGQLGPLPAGDYTAVVAIHLVRDGAIGTSVVATSGVVPLTVSDS
ncbi:hypothetical protein [Serinibacter arcticus]|uniref:hypothetical protein n=1 Tax=Serinibacter arcticus TaxID=1655435 RepID=UPI001091AAFB|nr:hypothetical protein [Serinibacter arcticus]